MKGIQLSKKMRANNTELEKIDELPELMNKTEENEKEADIKIKINVKDIDLNPHEKNRIFEQIK